MNALSDKTILKWCRGIFFGAGIIVIATGIYCLSTLSEAHPDEGLFILLFVVPSFLLLGGLMVAASLFIRRFPTTVGVFFLLIFGGAFAWAGIASSTFSLLFLPLFIPTVISIWIGLKNRLKRRR